MSDRKSRFNLFKFKKSGNDLNWSDDSKKSSDLGFPSFDSIIPESSPLKKNSDSSSGFFNDELGSKEDSSSGFFNDGFGLKGDSTIDYDLEGVDEKYAKYIFSQSSQNLDFENPKDDSKISDFMDSNEKVFNNEESSKKEGKIKDCLSNLKTDLLNKDNSSKTLFGKITFILIFLVLISSIFYFFVYQPFQNDLDLERNSKLNEVNALYKGPLELNENAYSLKNQISQAYDIEEIKSIDVLMSATKDWRIYHSSEIVSSKDEFGRVMMSYEDNKNIIMSVKDANDFVKDNDARILSNIRFEKVNTVIVPISVSRLQATAGLISVGSVVDIYSLSDNSSGYDYGDAESESLQSSDSSIINSSEDVQTMNSEDLESSDESLENSNEEPVVSGATVLAILRSKDSGLVDNTISRSNTLIKGNQTNPFENTSSYSGDVEEQLKSAVLNSNYDNKVLDSYLINYGIRLSNFERMSNLGDLDCQYIVLLEVPQGDVNFVINNMDNLILTIPTDFAPNWVVSELNETYYENLYQNQSLDFF